MTAFKLVKTIYIKAPPKRVWGYLTEPEKLATWFHRSDTELQAGKDYALLRENPDKPDPKLCWGRVLEADPPKRLVYTFTHDELKGVETRVIWELVAVDGGGTQVTMTHTGFEDAPVDALAVTAAHDAGWDTHFSRLRMVAS